jgi:hypothetical protein
MEEGIFWIIGYPGEVVVGFHPAPVIDSGTFGGYDALA